MTEVNKPLIREAAKEMMQLGVKEMNGDERAGGDFQRRMNFLDVCGPKQGTPWSEVAAQLRATYSQNQQAFDAGKPFNPDIPKVDLINGISERSAEIFFTKADYAERKNPYHKLWDTFIHPGRTDGINHSLPRYISGDVIKPEYTKDECVKLEPVKNKKTTTVGTFFKD